MAKKKSAIFRHWRMNKNCASPRHFLFLLPSPQRHRRFVTRSIKLERPTAPPREHSLCRTKPETIADVHTRTNTRTHTTARKKHSCPDSAGAGTEKFAPKRCGGPRDGSLKCTVRTQRSHTSHSTSSHGLDCPGRWFSPRNITAGLLTLLLLLLFWDEASTGVC